MSVSATICYYPMGVGGGVRHSLPKLSLSATIVLREEAFL